MKKILLSCAVAVFLAGCGTRSDPILPTESYSIPAIGSVATVGIGEHLISRYTGVLTTVAIDIHEELKADGFSLPAGRYKYQDDNYTGEWFFSDKKVHYFFRKKADGLICDDKTMICGRVKHEVVKKLSDSKQDSFQQTIIYNGRIGNKINIGYREFSNNLSRPSFSNNVEYDLDVSRVIGYKGARFEIVNATNTEITYKVLAGFSD